MAKLIGSAAAHINFQLIYLLAAHSWRSVMIRVSRCISMVFFIIFCMKKKPTERMKLKLFRFNGIFSLLFAQWKCHVSNSWCFVINTRRWKKRNTIDRVCMFMYPIATMHSISFHSISMDILWFHSHSASHTQAHIVWLHSCVRIFALNGTYCPEACRLVHLVYSVHSHIASYTCYS